MDVAATSNHFEALRFFHEHGPEKCSDEAMLQAAKNGYGAIVRFLYDNEINRSFGKRLRNAAGRGHLETLKVLVAGHEKNGLDQKMLIRVKYLRMVGFPAMAHSKKGFPVVTERACYLTIFDELMKKTEKHLGLSGASLVVTGNPEIGKSRFLIYIAFQLIHRLLPDGVRLPDFKLVLNHDAVYYEYNWSTNTFYRMSFDQVCDIKQDMNVIRLIDAISSTLTAWKGVSILFTLPELPELQKFYNLTPFACIVPVCQSGKFVPE